MAERQGGERAAENGDGKSRGTRLYLAEQVLRQVDRAHRVTSQCPPDMARGLDACKVRGKEAGWQGSGRNRPASGKDAQDRGRDEQGAKAQHAGGVQIHDVRKPSRENRWWSIDLGYVSTHVDDDPPWP